MRIMNLIHVLLLVVATFAGSTAVHAQAISGQGTWETTLQARDVGNTGTTNAFYDTALGVTWLRNANVNGTMDWSTAMSWASSLAVGGVGGWRLPTMTGPSIGGAWTYDGSTALGYNVLASTSEMANLFFSTLGNKSVFDTNANQVVWGGALTNKGNFQDMQSFVYWSGTEYAPSTNSAWDFGTNDGVQGANTKSDLLYAMAVHSGDVGSVVSAVPEPETYAMLLAGLGLIGAVVRSRRSDNALGATSCES